MTSIHCLNDKLLLHIIQLSYQNQSNPQWSKVNKKFHQLTKKFVEHYDLYNHLEQFHQVNWLINRGVQSNTVDKIEELRNQREYHQKRAKQEKYYAQVELLFGRKVDKLPLLITSCEDLMFQTIPLAELTAPIMQGFDTLGRRFVVLKIPSGTKATDSVVTYVFISEMYWRLHHNSGDRTLLGKTACYLSCLIKPYGFNPTAYRYCRDLFGRLMKKKIYRS